LGKLERDQSAPVQQYFLSLTNVHADDKDAKNEKARGDRCDEQNSRSVNDVEIDQTKLRLADSMISVTELDAAPINQGFVGEAQIDDEDDEIIINVHHKEIARNLTEEEHCPNGILGQDGSEYCPNFQQFGCSSEKMTEDAQAVFEEIPQNAQEALDGAPAEEEDNFDEAIPLTENLTIESHFDAPPTALFNPLLMDTVSEDGNIIPEFFSMDIEFSSFMAKDKDSVGSFASENTSANLPISEHCTPVKNDFDYPSRFSPRERLNLATSIPYKASGTYPCQ
jgi:hypothetical protein